ncbi:C40 family peptidase [Lactiplantibacillus nangangensis]|uniref:C40 family peptidase n=1 Tax=Lactiplantibacillus nangangensis TaxID=2559917 RepID=A0ABW1SI50_9LACO|nr:NlpC/P60 family protein [Lactiplantibacillus nangangensis]
MKRFAAIIVMLFASLTLFFATPQPVAAKATNRILTTTGFARTAFVMKRTNGTVVQFRGPAQNFQFKTIHLLRNYGQTTWFATQKRRLRLKTGQQQTYYYVTNSQRTAAGWVWDNNLKRSTHSFTNLMTVAKTKVGDRYRWGAVGPNRFDCSGYTQYVFKHGASKNLPRLAQAQYSHYRKVGRYQAKQGDLIFFGNSTRSITHVGIYTGHNQMINAQDSGVKYSKVYVPWWHVVGYSQPVNFSS